MKKYTLLFLSVFCSQLMWAQYCGHTGTNSGPTQCTPSGQLTQPGFSPSSNNQPSMINGAVSTTVIQFKNYDTINFSGQHLTVQWMRFDSIGNLPAGNCWTTNKSGTFPNGEANKFQNQEDGCIKINGTTCSTPGQYRLKMMVTANVGVPISTDLSSMGLYYYLRVKNTGAADIAIDTTGQTAGTNTFIAYGPASNCSGSTLSASTTKTDVNCFGQSTGSATAVPTGGTSYTYAWNNGGNTATISNLPAGTYTVTVTSNGAQTVTASAIISQPASAVSANATANQTSCSSNTGSATVTASGGTPNYSYLWNTGGTGSSISGLGGGTYTVTVTDSKSCTASASAVVTSPATFSLSVSTTNVNCFGQNTGDATANVTGGAGPFTYSWNNAATTSAITNLMAGTYNVTVTDGSGCTKTASGTVTQPANPLTVSATSSPSACSGSTGSVTATVSGNTGAVSYSWSNNATSSTVNNLAVGIYTVTVTSSGCTATASANVGNLNGPSMNVLKTDPSCFGSANGSATAVASGGTPAYTYTWSTGATGPTLSGIGAGNYTVIVSDASGCQATNSITLTQPNIISTNPTVTDVNCNGAHTGAISLSVAGGTGPYAYSWSNGSSSSSLNNLASGSFTVTVSDSRSCTAVSTNTVAQPSAIVITTSSTGTVSNNGTATAAVTGGNSPYNYSWSNSQTTSTATGLIPGQFSVTVTDSKGCTATASVTVDNLSGVDELLDALSKISLFPNPASTELNINTGGLSVEKIRIYTQEGKLVMDVKQPLNERIDISRLSHGTYIAEIKVKGTVVRRSWLKM